MEDNIEVDTSIIQNFSTTHDEFTKRSLKISQERHDTSKSNRDGHSDEGKGNLARRKSARLLKPRKRVEVSGSKVASLDSAMNNNRRRPQRG